MPMSPASMAPPQPSMVPPPAGMAVPQTPPPPQAPQPGTEPVLHLPDINMTVSIFPSEKKIVFNPQDHTAFTNKIRTYVNMMKQNFRIDDVNSLGHGAFEVIFDPRENFESVIQFLQQVGARAS